MKIPDKLIAEIKAISTETLQWSKSGKTHIWINAHPTVFEREGNVFVSAEDGALFADYYGEYRGGYPWIHEDLEKIAEKYGFYWEWENPGAIVLTN